MGDAVIFDRHLLQIS